MTTKEDKKTICQLVAGVAGMAGGFALGVYANEMLIQYADALRDSPELLRYATDGIAGMMGMVTGGIIGFHGGIIAGEVLYYEPVKEKVRKK